MNHFSFWGFENFCSEESYTHNSNSILKTDFNALPFLAVYLFFLSVQFLKNDHYDDFRKNWKICSGMGHRTEIVMATTFWESQFLATMSCAKFQPNRIQWLQKYSNSMWNCWTANFIILIFLQLRQLYQYTSRVKLDDVCSNIVTLWEKMSREKIELIDPVNGICGSRRILVKRPLRWIMFYLKKMILCSSRSNAYEAKSNQSKDKIGVCLRRRKFCMWVFGHARV